MVRARFGTLAVLGTLWMALPAPTARAQALQQVLDLNRQAMNAYTELELEQAKALLEQALQLARSANVRGAPLARTYMNLGVVMVGGYQDNARGIDYFVQALRADPTVQLDPFLSTPEVRQAFLLAKARAGHGGAASSSAPPPPPPPPPPPTGATAPAPAGSGPGNIPHDPVPEQLQQTAVPVFVEVPAEAPVAHMYVYYRGQGMREFKRLEMARMPGGFGAEIPCADVFPPKVEYYLVAFGNDGSPLGFAGTKDAPLVVPIVTRRTQPPPALPGKAPPQTCSLDRECPPGMPGCSNARGGKGMGETCNSSSECREGLVCDDNLCVEGEEDDDGDDGDANAPRVFLQLGGTLGLGWASAGMQADSAPPDGTMALGWIPAGDPGCDLPVNAEPPYCVRVEQSGLVPTFALRATAGAYVTSRLGLAATVRYQLDAGQGSFAHMLLGLRGQYLLTPPAPTGFQAAIFLGTSFGQIQLRPPQDSPDEPYIISGLNGVQVGSSMVYRVAKHFGFHVTPEVNVLLPTFLFDVDLSAGIEIGF